MSGYWVESEPGTVHEITFEEWKADWLDDERRKVARTDLDGFIVSTVHLGLDHRFGDGPPLIYETMVFDQREGSESPWTEIYGERYTYRADAVTGHARAVEWVLAGRPERT